MTPRGTGPAHWYSASLAIALVAIAFSNAALYLFQSGVVDQPPFWWLAALGGLAAPMAIQYTRSLRVPVAPMLGWLVFYVVLTVSWFAMFPATPEADFELRRRLQSIGYICLVWLIVQQPGALSVVRWAILAATTFAGAVNLFEFFHPGAFSLTTGRAAGLYMNPNSSGAALLFGMLVSIPLLAVRWRAVFVFAIGLGILATFSRAALAGWTAMAASLMLDELRTSGIARLFTKLFAIGAIVGIVVIGVLHNLNPEQGAALGDVVADRLGTFMSEDARDDLSTSERRELTGRAMESIGQHPWSGAGLGTNRFLDRETGSHNQYLDLMVQHGLAGVLVLPLLAVALIYGSRGQARADAIRFAFLLLFLGFFSHNMLDERYLLTAVVVQAAISRASYSSPDSGQ